MYVAPFVAWASVQEQLVEHMAARSLEELFETVPDVGNRAANSHAKLVQQGAVAVVAYSSPGRVLSSGIMQKVLTSHIHKQTLRSLKANMDNEAAAFLRAASGKAAGAFLEAPSR